MRSPTPELDNNDRLFDAAEARRRGEFDETMLHQEALFAEEETLYRKGSKLRRETFEKFMVALDTLFYERSIQRKDARNKAEADQESTFHENENRRNKEFAEVEARREDTFQADQVRLTERVEWYLNIQERYIQRGQGSQEESCRLLEKQITDQFSSTLRELHESFAKGQTEREDVVKNMAGTRTDPWHFMSQMQTEVRAGAPSAFLPPEDILQPTPNAHTSSRSHSPIHSLPGDSPLDSLHLTWKRGRGRGPNRTGSYSPVQTDRSWSRSWSPPRIIEVRPRRSHSFSPPDQSPPRRMPMPPPKQLPILSDHVEWTNHPTRFETSQEFQELYFLSLEEHRDARFRQREAERDGDELKMVSNFSQAESSRNRTFEAFIKRGEQQLTEAEQVRGLAVKERSKKFEAAQRRREYLFTQLLTWAERRYLVNNSLATDWVKALQNKVAKLERMQVEEFGKAKRRWIEVFFAEAVHYLSMLGRGRVVDPKSESKSESQLPGSPVMPSEDDRHSMVIARATLSSGGRFNASERPANRHRSRSVSRRREHRSRSPPTGLDARQIVTTQYQLNDSLPTPDEVTSRAHPKAQGFAADQRRHRRTFDRAQEERERRYEAGARKRSHTSRMNEGRREAEFEDNQAQRRQIATRAESARDSMFTEAQEKLGKLFRDAEGGRAAEFLVGEAKRGQTFVDMQTSHWEGVFYASMEELLAGCSEEEIRRQSAFDAWVRGRRAAIETRDQMQRREFSILEKKFQTRFNNLIIQDQQS